MITSSHLVYNWALAKATERTPDRSRTLAFLLGGVVPDLPTYLFFVVHGLILGTSQETMWRELYFDSAWTPYITLSHSLLIWPALLALGVTLGRRFLTYLASAALFHICIDFFVHHNDAYRHFWPVSDWRFLSPLSYWDPRYYGDVVGIVDTLVVLALLVWLHQRYTATPIRTVLYLTATAYLLITLTPVLSFVFN